MLVSATLASFILAGVLGTFLMLGRSGYNASSYSVMEAEARRALETFSEEARMAKNIQTAANGLSVALTVVTSTGQYTVTYAYDNAASGTTSRCFYRVLGTLAAPTSSPRILVRGVQDFAFRRYKVVNGADFTTTSDVETKQVQLTLRAIRSRATVVDATNAVLSARVVLRNKVVST